jgi:hypothetical protein
MSKFIQSNAAFFQKNYSCLRDIVKCLIENETIALSIIDEEEIKFYNHFCQYFGDCLEQNLFDEDNTEFMEYVNEIVSIGQNYCLEIEITKDRLGDSCKLDELHEFDQNEIDQDQLVEGDALFEFEFDPNEAFQDAISGEELQAQAARDAQKAHSAHAPVSQDTREIRFCINFPGIIGRAFQAYQDATDAADLMNRLNPLSSTNVPEDFKKILMPLTTRTCINLLDSRESCQTIHLFVDICENLYKWKIGPSCSQLWLNLRSELPKQHAPVVADVSDKQDATIMQKAAVIRLCVNLDNIIPETVIALNKAQDIGDLVSRLKRLSRRDVPKEVKRKLLVSLNESDIQELFDNRESYRTIDQLIGVFQVIFERTWSSSSVSPLWDSLRSQFSALETNVPKETPKSQKF